MALNDSFYLQINVIDGLVRLLNKERNMTRLIATLSK